MKTKIRPTALIPRWLEIDMNASLKKWIMGIAGGVAMVIMFLVWFWCFSATLRALSEATFSSPTIRIEMTNKSGD